MKLGFVKYSRLNLSFRTPFVSATTTQTNRNIFVISMEDENGKVFWGESAPLPEFGSESFEDIETQLKELALMDYFNLPHKIDKIFDYTESLNLLPTIEYAFEHIFIQKLLSYTNGYILGLSKNRKIEVNGVVDIDNYRATQIKLKSLIDSGFKTIKLKTNNDNFEELVNLISWSDTISDKEIRFRIDPNCSWNLTDSLRRAEQLEKFSIEYLEQPVKEKNDLLKLAEKSPVQIAADESIRNLNDAIELTSNTELRFLVIKPMLFGGLRNVMKLNELIKDTECKLVLSSSLESNLGRRHLIFISAVIDNDLSHGFATSTLFEQQPTEDAFEINAGQINFSIDKYLSTLKVNL